MKISNLFRISSFGFRVSPTRGFTLVEVIIDAVVVTLIFGVVISSFLVMLNATNSGHIRALAGALANEQMEQLRNMAYDDLSTQSGAILPQGTIPDSQTVTRNNRSFTLATKIIYVDDPFDGCAIPVGNGQSSQRPRSPFETILAYVRPTAHADPGSGAASGYECTDGQIVSSQDVIPVDYKRLTIEVKEVGRTIVVGRLSSNVAGKAAETASDTGVILAIILDANGNPVDGATVTITNPSTNISITAVTNNKGYLFVAGLPPDNQNGYHIVATKDGYSTESTTSRTEQNPNQSQPDVDVAVQQVTTQTLAIDRIANLILTVTNQLGEPVSNFVVTATSSKITQFNPEVAKNIYTQTTNTIGQATYSGIEWDSYSLSVPDGYYILATSPYQKVVVNPNETINAFLTVSSNSNWPRITDIAPTSGQVNNTIEVTINGENFSASTTVTFTKAGFPNLIPTTTDVASNQKSITITLDLTGVATGEWHMVVSTPSNGTITQLNGFSVAE